MSYQASPYQKNPYISDNQNPQYSLQQTTSQPFQGQYVQQTINQSHYQPQQYQQQSSQIPQQFTPYNNQNSYSNQQNVSQSFTKAPLPPQHSQVINQQPQFQSVYQSQLPPQNGVLIRSTSPTVQNQINKGYFNQPSPYRQGPINSSFNAYNNSKFYGNSPQTKYKESFGYDTLSYLNSDGIQTMSIAGHGNYQKVQLQQRTWGPSDLQQQQSSLQNQSYFQKSQNNLFTKQKFYNFLVEQANMEYNIEQAKQKLAEYPQFNLNYLMYLFDREKKGIIFPHEFQDAIITHFQIDKAPIKEIDQFFKQHSNNPNKSYSGSLDIQSAKEIFIPLLRQRNINYSQVNKLDSQASSLIRDVLIAHFQAEKNFLTFQTKLRESKFDLNTIFHEIDQDGNGVIILRELLQILQKYDANMSQEAGELLFKRMAKYDPYTIDTISKNKFWACFTQYNNEKQQLLDPRPQLKQSYNKHGYEKGRILIDPKSGNFKNIFSYPVKLNLFCQAQVGNQIKETLPHHNSGLQPIWKSNLAFFRDDESVLKLQLYNEDEEKNQKILIGEGEFDLNELFHHRKQIKQIPIHSVESQYSHGNHTHHKKSIEIGELSVTLQWIPDQY